MTKVIAAIDNSPTARPVLDAALALASLLRAEVEAVHVREDGHVEAERAAEGASVPLALLHGPVSKALIEAATDDAVEAVVLGTKDIASSAVGPGHVTMETVAAIGKPVLAVPPDARGPSRLRNVVVPLDGKLDTSQALSRAFALARANDLNVRVVHVHDKSCLPPFEDQPQHESAAWAHEFACRYCSDLPDGNEQPVDITIGEPGDQILAVSEERGTDLIVLGWKRDLTEGRAAVVRNLLDRSSIPVLLYPITAES
jgi:nucleotide-binding universal stress UspA family protein